MAEPVRHGAAVKRVNELDTTALEGGNRALQHGVFPTTHWSIIRRAGGHGGEASKALGQLCEQYWQPIYCYLRRRGNSAADAADLTQGFFARLLEKRDIASANQEVGRFRSFLLGAVKHYEMKQHEREKALKRGGGAFAISLDQAGAEAIYQRDPCVTETPERAFCRRWALDVLQQARELVRVQYIEAGKSALFEELGAHISGFENASPLAVSAERLGMTENAAKVAAHRLRQRYGQVLRELIGRTVGTQEELDDEILFLIACVER